MAFWRERVAEWYPQLEERAYFLPPVFMNRTGERATKIYGTEVYVTKFPVDDVPPGGGPVLHNSDVREDRSQQDVLKCLRKVSEAGKEVMFVLSQLNFNHYLHCYSAAAATSNKLPTPLDLRKENLDQGDFDVLVLHRHLGILVGEIKAVGDNFQRLGLPEQEQEKKVLDKVKSAAKQLKKAHQVLSHLTKKEEGSQQPSPRIVKTLMLPNVSSVLLRQTLDNNPTVKEDVCDCLDLSHSADPVPYCLTSDDLDTPDPWWQLLMKDKGDDPAMKDKEVYLDLVSRFCGPATTVSVFCSSDPRLGHRPDVRTEGEGVSETAHRFTRFMVTPGQLTVLHVSPPLVFLVGPPGTGKTFVLVLKALDWVLKGEHVLILSIEDGGEAASFMIRHQLEQTLLDQSAKSRIHFVTLGLESGWEEDDVMTAAVTSLVEKVKQGVAHIIADEATLDNDATRFKEVFEKLYQECPGVKLWASSMFHMHRPAMMTEVKLTEPLRSPPGVTDLVQQTLDNNPMHPVFSYTAGASPLPTVGPPVRELLHEGQGHEEDQIIDCVTCGERVARVLTEELHVGGKDRNKDSPKALAYRDVLVVCATHPLDPETFNMRGFLRGLHNLLGPHVGLVSPAAGSLSLLPTGQQIIGSASASGPTLPTLSLSDVATYQGPDVVTVATAKLIVGLERKVVAYVGNMNDAASFFQRGASRCTGQLLYVLKPLELFTGFWGRL